MGNLHALLVGIDTYKSQQINPLSACVKDVEHFSDYLTSVLPDKCTIEKLTNSDATKSGLEAIFQDFFISDKRSFADDDTLLFYYSGHGCQEKADEEIWGEKYLEALVCHDALHDGMPPFADKELRYLFHLISQKTKARIIFISDSCNSGGISRGLSKSNKRLGPRMNTPRVWDQFIFSDHIGNERQHGKSINQQIPQAGHILMAACESHQTAYELAEEQGIFTSSLLDALEQTNGKGSFNEIHTRVRYLVRQRFGTQTPVLYARASETNRNAHIYAADMLNTEFLTGAKSSSKLYANVNYTDDLWRIDRGGIHGLHAGVDFKILEKGSETQIAKADILKIYPDYCVIEPLPLSESEKYHPLYEPEDDDQEGYKAIIEGIYTEPLAIYLGGDQESLAKLRLDFEEQEISNDFRKFQVKFVDQRVKANYQIILGKEDGIITLAGDAEELSTAQPICKSVKLTDARASRILADYLLRIAHWHRAKALQNPNPREKRSDLLDQIEWEIVYQPAYLKEEEQEGRMTKMIEKLDQKSFNPDTDTNGNKVLHEKDELNLEILFPKRSDSSIKKVFCYFKFRIRNNADYPVYVSIIYLGQLFGLHSNTFENDILGNKIVKRLEPKKDYWFKVGDSPEGRALEIPSYIYDQGRQGDQFYLKLILSNTDFELNNSFNQPALPAPDARKYRGDNQDQASYGFPAFEDWGTKMVGVHSLNPEYNPG